jgi:hypothetical protein
MSNQTTGADNAARLLDSASRMPLPHLHAEHNCARWMNPGHYSIEFAYLQVRCHVRYCICA